MIYRKDKAAVRLSPVDFGLCPVKKSVVYIALQAAVGVAVEGYHPDALGNLRDIGKRLSVNAERLGIAEFII